MPLTVDLSVKPEVKGFFDPATNTISYVVQGSRLDLLRHRRFRDGHRLCRRAHHL